MITNVDRTSKNQPRWLGPYIVKAYGENRTYILEDLAGAFLRRLVPVRQIRLLESGDRRSKDDLKETHYEIDAIVNHRKTDDDKFEYLTAFVGYNEPEWIIESDFNSKATISDYWSKRKAIEDQQKGNFKHLPDSNMKRKYNRKNFNVLEIENNNTSSSTSTTPPIKMNQRRSNRLKK